MMPMHCVRMLVGANRAAIAVEQWVLRDAIVRPAKSVCAGSIRSVVRPCGIRRVQRRPFLIAGISATVLMVLATAPEIVVSRMELSGAHPGNASCAFALLMRSAANRSGMPTV